MQRIKQYSLASTSLAVLSNEKLKQILADGKPMHDRRILSVLGKSLGPLYTALLQSQHAEHHYQ